MGNRLGLDAVLYRNTATYATPTWSEISNARDVTLNLESGEADASRRGGGGWEEVLKALKSGSIEFELLYDNADAEFLQHVGLPTDASWDQWRAHYTTDDDDVDMERVGDDLRTFPPIAAHIEVLTAERRAAEEQRRQL